MSIDTLISQLSDKARPVKYTPFWQVCAEWLGVTAISFGIVAAFYGGLRVDLATRLTQPLYLGELLMNLSLILTAGFTATSLAYPDRAGTRLLRYVFAVPLLLFCGVFVAAVNRSPSVSEAIFHTHGAGYACLKCIAVFAVVPAAWMLFRLRTLMVVKPMWATGLSLLMALASGGLGIRVVETEPLTAGLLLWHYLPMIGVCLIGVSVGRKIFR